MRAVLPLCVGLLLLPALGWAQVLSPGPLVRAHESVDGDNQCTECHSRGMGTPDALCNDCHGEIKRRRDARRGYHGGVSRKDACISCHKDHLGRDGDIIRWPGGSEEAFPHRRTSFVLRGAHAETECRDCHNKDRIVDADALALTERETWLGMSRTCSGCHEEEYPHEGQFRARECTECHGETAWPLLPTFDHEITKFPLRGAHLDVDCADCHHDGQYLGVPMTCDGCHPDRHEQHTGFGTDCAECHSPKDWHQSVYDRVLHDSFPLEQGHDLPQCAECHDQDGNKAVKAGCEDCHEDDHDGRLGKDCERCHGIKDWQTIFAGQFSHDKTRFPLRGQHIDATCRDCHKGKEPVHYGLPFDTCARCHEAGHEGEPAEVACADCHVVEGFAPSTYPLEKHETFPLARAHGAVACDDCHRPLQEIPAETKRPWDFREGVRSDACADCHKDPHDGQFEPRACAACHDSGGWGVQASAQAGAQGGWDHSHWPLEGPHAEAECKACHEDGRYVGLPTACAGCHGSPHLGQFAGISPRLTCEACHSTDTWDSAYDHDPIWPLEGEHADAECDTCHREVTVADGGMTVRWRLGFQTCSRCHEGPHVRKEGVEVLDGDAAFGTCDRCHTPAAWTQPPTQVDDFEHEQTGFPLENAHAGARCDDCHQGGETVSSCESCHQSPHEGSIDPRCDRCHGTKEWRIPDFVVEHRRLRLPLVGRHASVPCSDCHPRAVETRYVAVPAQCSDCHQDEVRPGMTPDHTRFAENCGDCHRPYGWRPATFQHDRFWPLVGAHRAVECQACHTHDRYAGLPSDCVDCHRADFRRGHPAGGDTSCASCHTPNGWLVVSLDFHQASFPLPHQGASDCASCHPGGDTISFTCLTCHEHSQALMDPEHRRVRGYIYESAACYRCHPRGQE